MQLDNIDNFDNISEQVRRFCAQQLFTLEKSLRPWIDGSFGDISPAHLHGYLSTLKELANLYEAHKRPQDARDMIPAARVEAMLHELEAGMQARIQEAVAEAEARVRAELEQGSKLSLEAARSSVSSRLAELIKRQ